MYRAKAFLLAAISLLIFFGTFILAAEAYAQTCDQPPPVSAQDDEACMPKSDMGKTLTVGDAKVKCTSQDKAEVVDFTNCDGKMVPVTEANGAMGVTGPTGAAGETGTAGGPPQLAPAQAITPLATPPSTDGAAATNGNSGTVSAPAGSTAAALDTFYGAPSAATPPSPDSAQPIESAPIPGGTANALMPAGAPVGGTLDAVQTAAQYTPSTFSSSAGFPGEESSLPPSFPGPASPQAAQYAVQDAQTTYNYVTGVAGNVDPNNSDAALRVGLVQADAATALNNAQAWSNWYSNGGVMPAPTPTAAPDPTTVAGQSQMVYNSLAANVPGAVLTDQMGGGGAPVGTTLNTINSEFNQYVNSGGSQALQAAFASQQGAANATLSGWSQFWATGASNGISTLPNMSLSAAISDPVGYATNVATNLPTIAAVAVDGTIAGSINGINSLGQGLNAASSAIGSSQVVANYAPWLSSGAQAISPGISGEFANSPQVAVNNVMNPNGAVVSGTMNVASLAGGLGAGFGITSGVTALGDLGEAGFNGARAAFGDFVATPIENNLVPTFGETISGGGAFNSSVDTGSLATDIAGAKPLGGPVLTEPNLDAVIPAANDSLAPTDIANTSGSAGAQPLGVYTGEPPAAPNVFSDTPGYTPPNNFDALAKETLAPFQDSPTAVAIADDLVAGKVPVAEAPVVEETAPAATPPQTAEPAPTIPASPPEEVTPAAVPAEVAPEPVTAPAATTPESEPIPPNKSLVPTTVPFQLDEAKFSAALQGPSINLDELGYSITQPETSGERSIVPYMYGVPTALGAVAIYDLSTGGTVNAGVTPNASALTPAAGTLPSWVTSSVTGPFTGTGALANAGATPWTNPLSGDQLQQYLASTKGINGGNNDWATAVSAASPASSPVVPPAAPAAPPAPPAAPPAGPPAPPAGPAAPSAAPSESSGGGGGAGAGSSVLSSLLSALAKLAGQQLAQQALSSCPTPPTAPTCAAGATPQPMYTQSGSNSCVSSYQCVGSGAAAASPTPTPQISCTPQVADVNESVSISYSCQNATGSSGNGFSTGNNLSGTASATIAAPPSGTNTANYALTCTNNGQTANAQCSIQINQPFIDFVANPATVAPGQTSTIGWTTGNTMQSCVVSSPDDSTFTTNNAGNQSTSGAAESDPITSPTTFILSCTTLGGTVETAETVVTN